MGSKDLQKRERKKMPKGRVLKDHTFNTMEAYEVLPPGGSRKLLANLIKLDPGVTIKRFIIDGHNDRYDVNFSPDFRFKMDTMKTDIENIRIVIKNLLDQGAHWNEVSKVRSGIGKLFMERSQALHYQKMISEVLNQDRLPTHEGKMKIKRNEKKFYHKIPKKLIKAKKNWSNNHKVLNKRSAPYCNL